MKKLLLLAACALFATNTFAQSEEDMKAWMDYATPGDMHEMMATYAGEWDEKVTHYMPGQPPMKQEATMTLEMVMDGRYQKLDFGGDFMGMPFHGLSYTGYDNARQLFMNTWIDNLGTGIMYIEGKYNPSTKTIVYRGKTTDPVAKAEMDVREDFTFVDDDHMRMVMYMVQDGKEIKTMEIDFSRKN